MMLISPNGSTRKYQVRDAVEHTVNTSDDKIAVLTAIVGEILEHAPLMDKTIIDILDRGSLGAITWSK